MTKANADGSVTLSVTATKNQSVFKGWTGDAIGCKGTATTISIIPSVDKFTCQPLFNKQILGTTNCPVDDPTCCNLSNPKCPAIPEDCNPPQDPNTQWLLSIPISNSSAFLRIQITNLSHQNREVVASLYDVNGGEVFVNKTLVEMGNLAPFATVSLTLENLTANGVTWTGRATLKIVNAEGLLAQSFLRPHASLTGLSTSNIGYGTTKHRISYIPTNSVVTPGADTGTIVITNIADIPVKNVSARLFTPDGPTELAPKATLRISSDNLGKIFEVKALKGKAFMEIFPQDVTQRCNGKMLIQNFIQQKNIAFSPLINVTPVDW
jgi:hypothetical protein